MSQSFLCILSMEITVTITLRLQFAIDQFRVFFGSLRQYIDSATFF